MYHTYITDAFVCGSQNRNTADRSYLLFTREAGMLFAIAKSVREERSKNRYALQEFSKIRVSLIRGKSGWRIASTEPIASVYACATERNERALVRNIFQLLRRTIQGEESHHELFDLISDAFAHIGTYDAQSCEAVLTLRILHLLGYVAPQQQLDQYMHGNIDFEEGLLMSSNDLCLCQQAIAHALENSQL